MSAITTDGWGEQGGLVTTDGWGGQPSGKPAQPVALEPVIRATVELAPQLVETVVKEPRIVSALDAKIEPVISSTVELTPSVDTSRKSQPETTTTLLRPKLR